jgi:hypothetical protein
MLMKVARREKRTKSAKNRGYSITCGPHIDQSPSQLVKPPNLSPIYSIFAAYYTYLADNARGAFALRVPRVCVYPPA